MLWSSHCEGRCRANSRLSVLQWLQRVPRGPPVCGTGLISGSWHTCAPTHVMHPASNWAHNKWKHRAQACSLRLWRGLRGGVGGQLLSQSDLFSTRRPKSTFQLTYSHQNADWERKREEMEGDGEKMTKRVSFFPSPPEKLRFHRFGSPSFGSPHAYSYSSGQTSSITSN